MNKNESKTIFRKMQLWLKGSLRRYMISIAIMISLAEILVFAGFVIMVRGYLEGNSGNENIIFIVTAALIIFLLINFMGAIVGIKKLSMLLVNFINRTKQIADGNYSAENVDVEFSEFAELSNNFNVMKTRISLRELEAKVSGERFENIAKYLPVGIVIFDFSGRISYVNPRVTEIFGYTHKDFEQPLVLMNSAFPDEHIRKRTVEIYRSDISRCMKNMDVMHPSRIYRLVSRSGIVIYTEVTIAIYNELIYHVLVDISLRKKAEDELVILNLELEKMVGERTSELRETNDKLEATNREFSQTNEELERIIDQLQKTQDQLLHNEKLALLGQLAAGIAHEINTPLGAIISANDHQSRMYARILPSFPEFIKSLNESECALFTEIYPMIKHDDEDLPYKEKRAVKKSLAEILAGANISDPPVIADDLIDLGIYGDIEKYLSGFAEKRAHEILRMINNLKSLVISGSIISQASGKAAKVIGALKTYSHTSSKDVKSAEDITSSIDTVLTLYYNKTKSGIKIIKKYEPVLPVICYPDRLGQVWTNLINNAFYAMDYNGILQIWARMVDGKVSVSITDNGKGIDKSVQDKIFNPFFTTKKSGEGTGLGLDIVKKIVEEQGGTVSFESEPGRTVFTVSLDPGGSAQQEDGGLDVR